MRLFLVHSDSYQRTNSKELFSDEAILEWRFWRFAANQIVYLKFKIASLPLAMTSD